MRSPHLARQAEEILKDAYPDDRDRARAIKRLSWIASRLQGRRSFKLSDLSCLLPRPVLLAARTLMFVLVCCVADGVDTAVAPHGYAFPAGIAMTAILIFILVVFPRARHAILFADFVLFLASGERMRFGRLLTVAARHGVVSGNASGYTFTDPRMPQYLVAWSEVARSEHAARKAAHVNRSPALAVIADIDRHGYFLIHAGVWTWDTVRAWLDRIPRTLAGLIGMGILRLLLDYSGFLLIAFTVGSPLLAVAGGIVRAVCWTPLNWATFSRKTQITAVATVAVAIAAVAAGAATAAATVVVYLLPAAFMAVLGLWACVLVYRATRGRNGRRWQVARHATLIAAELATITLVIHRALLTTVPAFGVLFPPAVWGAFRLWRTMREKERPVVLKVGANITLGVALGTALLLFLIWLANLIDLPRSDMAELRHVLDGIKADSEPDWWIWMLIWVLLAGLSLAFALCRTRLAPIRRWVRQLRILPGADVVSQGMSVIHIGLLAIVLVAATAPAGLSRTFQGQLKTAYLVALQREFAAQGDLAAFERILRRLKTVHRGVGPDSARTVLGTLPSLVADIHRFSPPPKGAHGATGGEDDLARRLGILQWKSLRLPAQAGRSVQAVEQERAREEGFDNEAADATQLTGESEKVEAADQAADGAVEDATQFGENAARALAALALGVVPLPENEVLQILKEYLSGLFEASPLAEVFTALAEKLPGPRAPSAQDVVVPDPRGLEQAAVANALDVPRPAAGSLDAAVSLTGRELKKEASGAECAECRSGGSGSGQDNNGDIPSEDPVEFDPFRLVKSQPLRS